MYTDLSRAFRRYKCLENHPRWKVDCFGWSRWRYQGDGKPYASPSLVSQLVSRLSSSLSVDLGYDGWQAVALIHTIASSHRVHGILPG